MPLRCNPLLRRLVHRKRVRDMQDRGHHQSSSLEANRLEVVDLGLVA